MARYGARLGSEEEGPQRIDSLTVRYLFYLFIVLDVLDERMYLNECI